MFVFLSRLVMLVIALSVLRSAVAFLQGLWTDLAGANPAPRRTPAAANGGTTVLQQDPVCGTYVPTETSLKRIVDGKVLHFCSNDCRDRYKA